MVRSLPRTTISLILAAVAVCVLLVISEAGFQRSSAALQQVTDAGRIRTSLHLLMQQMLDAETGSRGYLLTGQPGYLDPYSKAVAGMGPTLEQLRQAYAGDAQALQALAQIGIDVQRKLTEMDLSIRMRQQGNEDAWKFVLNSDVGKEHMDTIRGRMQSLVDAASLRMDASRDQIHISLLLARVGIAAVAAIALLAFYLYLRQTRALESATARQQQALQQERDLLERQVRERTASLAELATHLQQVREQERGHLARELHDELGALLTAAKLDVARLKSRLGDPGSEAAQRLQHLNDTLNSGIALKRRIIEDLRPSSLANLGLSASLEILAREFSEQSGVDVVTNLEPVQLDESNQLTIYRMVQESLTNVAKYAEARQVVVQVHGFGNVVEIMVRDDGKGFDTANLRSATHGLAGMRHRVEAAGGKFTVRSDPGKGTQVSAVLPQGRAMAAPLAMA